MSGQQFVRDRRRLVARLLVAVGTSMVLCALLARFAAPTLTGPTDIVGYPTFENFNFEPWFWNYRLTVFALPLLSIVGYALLTRFGPLRSQLPRSAGRDIKLVEPAPTAAIAPQGASWSSPARIVLPAVVVVVAGSSRTGRTDLLAVAAGVVYLVLALAAAELVTRRSHAHRGRALATVNGVGGAVAAILSLWFVSAHTVVQSSSGARTWPWMAWWLPVLGVAAIVWWSVHQLRNGRDPSDVELTLLTVVVGSIALFLAISVLPGQVPHFQGFDDAVEMAGASVVAHGYFPWRDLLFIHGVFPDVLIGSLGWAIFDGSIWGVWAIHTVVLVPLFWVSTYLFAVWVSRRNPGFLVLVFLSVTTLIRPLLESAQFAGPRWELLWSERFIGLPLALIVLGETLRRRSVTWAVGLTLMLFAEEILVPETIFAAGPAFACVVAAEVVHRRRDRSMWTNLWLTRCCIGTGLAAMAAWCLFLMTRHALGAFIDYYVVFGPGHNLAGAIPPTRIGLIESTMLVVDIGCVLVTVCAVAVKVATRADWEARDWTAVAAAAFVAVYVQKALGRFDAVHAWQVFAASLPLVLFWSWHVLAWLGRVFAGWWRGRDARPFRFAQPVAAVVLPAIALGFAFVGPPLANAGRQHHIAGVNEAAFDRLGYAAPGAVDTGLLRDLDTSIRAYAGDDGPVFDMTNSPGYVFFVLGRLPRTRFLHVSMAIPAYAQRLLIDELTAVRPPVVIYDASSIGMATWDGITNNVRHYQVSEYILRGWSPVLRTHGILVMARNDLAHTRPVPVLSTQPLTRDLYFTGPTCNWGATPNYLPVPDSGRATKVAVQPVMKRMLVDYAGWAIDPATSRSPNAVLITDGDRVVYTMTPSIDRPDIAMGLHQPKSVSGFQYTGSFAASAHPSAYFIGADGLAHRLGGAPAGSVAALRMPDGSRMGVAPSVGGHLDVHKADVYGVGRLELPSSIDLRDYDLATLSSTGGLDGATVALTDEPGQRYHDISARWLDQAGPHLTLRVGSCPQWYGYDASKPLYLLQSGGQPVTSITLSAIRR